MKHTPQGKVRVLEGRICGWNSVDKERQGDQDRKEWKRTELRTPRKRNVGANGNFWPFWTPNDMQVGCRRVCK